MVKSEVGYVLLNLGRELTGPLLLGKKSWFETKDLLSFENLRLWLWPKLILIWRRGSLEKSYEPARASRAKFLVNCELISVWFLIGCSWRQTGQLIWFVEGLKRSFKHPEQNECPQGIILKTFEGCIVLHRYAFLARPFIQTNVAFHFLLFWS